MDQNWTSRSRKHSFGKENHQIQHAPVLNRVKSYSLNKSDAKLQPNNPINEQKYLMGWGHLPSQAQNNQKSKTIKNIAKHSISYSVGQKFIAYVDKHFSLKVIGQLPTQQFNNFSKQKNQQIMIDSFKNLLVKKVFSTPFSIFMITCSNQVLAFGINNRGQLGVNNINVVNFPIIIKSLSKFSQNSQLSTNSSRKRSSSKVKINSVCYQNKALSQKNLNKLEQNNYGFQNSQKLNNSLLQYKQQVVKFQGGPFHTVLLTNKGRIFYTGNLYTKKSLKSNQYITNFKQVSLDKVGKVVDIKSGVSNIAILNSKGRLFLMGLFHENNLFDEPIDIQIDRVKNFAISNNNVYIVNDFGAAYRINMQSKIVKASKYNVDINFKYVEASLDYAIFLSQDGVLYGQGNNAHDQILVNNKSKYVQPLTLIDYFKLKVPITQLKCSSNFLVFSSQKIISSNLTHHQNYHQQKIISINKQSIQKKSIRIQTQTQVKSLFSNLNFTINPRTFQSDLEIQFSQIKLGKKIAEGGYGIIYQGQWRKSTVAVKIFKIDENNQNSIKDFVSQCHAMETLRHPNIVMFLGACIKLPNFAIVLQYCEGGTLWSLLQSKIQLNWNQKINFALDIARAMNYLHSRNSPILHRDLKSLNILLDSSMRIKLADFGWTKGLQNYMTGKIGTYQWMAPQVIAAQQYTQKADIFSFAIILWQIASRQAPYKNIQGLQVAYDVVNKDLRPTIPKNTPQIFSNLIVRCWNKQAEQRPSFSEIIDQLQKINSILK